MLYCVLSNNGHLLLLYVEQRETVAPSDLMHFVEQIKDADLDFRVPHCEISIFKQYLTVLIQLKSFYNL